MQVHPDANLVVLEASDSVGGTWSKQRLYPGLKSNNIYGTLESPDFPMDGKKYGVEPGQHIPGPIVHRYLNEFAKKFGVLHRVRLNTRVETIRETAHDTWLLTVATQRGSERTTAEIHAQKIIFAHGLTNEPNLPHFEGRDSFGAPLFHGRDFGRNAGLLKSAKNVAVFGSAKSAFDAVYEYASNGVTVDWVIRESGRGPAWMCPTRVTPFKYLLEYLLITRVCSLFTPFGWEDADGYGLLRGFLHQTMIGRWFVRLFWAIIEMDVITLIGFGKDPKLDALRPWSAPFWHGTSVSLLNYQSDFFQHVRSGKVRIHTSDIECLRPRSVVLRNGTVLQVEALHCATGWKHNPKIKFEPENLVQRLGMPHHSKEMNKLTRDADLHILAKYPALQERPNLFPKRAGFERKAMECVGEPDQLYRLHRYIVPPSFIEKRNVAFVGMVLNIATMPTAQAQSLWVTAFFDRKLSMPADVHMETELLSRFGKWRYPASYGVKHGDLVFDTVPYIDLLLKDLDISVKRKANFVKELFEPYAPKDYRNVVGEWIQASGWRTVELSEKKLVL